MQLLSTSHHIQLPTGLPPSPTLTNPDMILPYNSPSSVSTSSITPRESQQYLTQQSRAGDSSGFEENGQGDMTRGVPRLFGNGAKSSRRDTSQATPLREDVNEKMWNRAHKPNAQSRERLILTPSPVPGDEYGLGAASVHSHTEIKNGHWEGFDGPVEEIGEDPYDVNADTSRKLLPKQEPASPAPSSNAQDIRTILDEDEDDPQSHAAMSKRAELILANAKKRLLTMESNLNRARYGLNSRPSSSMSSFANHSPEPVSLYTVPGRQSSGGLYPTKHRQPSSSTAPGGYRGHARVSSETSIPSSRYNGPQTLERDNDQPSYPLDPVVEGGAALDHSEERDFDNERQWFWTGLNRNGNNSARINQTLEPLHEDEPAPVSFDSPPSRNSQHHNFPVDRNSSNSSPSDRESPPAGGLTRARSTNQMRDLRDQMQDLKGKISNLKQRAREDSLRRRSLQSLRTPSPFTAAEQWYTGASGHLVKHSNALDDSVEHKNETQGDNSDQPRVLPHTNDVLQNTEPTSAVKSKDVNLEVEEHLLSEIDYNITQVQSEETHGPVELSQSNVNSDTAKETYQTNTNSHIAVDDDAPKHSADEVSSHESLTSPIGERHEDRPDAFDYENFYLHSSMGHYGRSDVSRTSSHSSMYSVETTKPANNLVAEPSEIDDNNHGSLSNEDSTSRYSGHLRQNSGESVSTVATFATATEGRASDEEPEEEWVNRRPMAGSWQPEYHSKHKSNRNGGQVAKEGSQPAFGIRVDTTVNKPSNTTKSPSFSPNTPTQPPCANSMSLHSSLDLLSALSGPSGTEAGGPAKTIQLNDRDKELVERLIQSLSKVCIKLHNGSVDGGRYESRLWRRRIDAARRVLDGETNGEAF